MEIGMLVAFLAVLLFWMVKPDEWKEREPDDSEPICPHPGHLPYYDEEEDYETRQGNDVIDVDYSVGSGYDGD